MSRQAVYQSEKRFSIKQSTVGQVIELIHQVRCKMPRLGTRKLYFLLKDSFVERGIKIGRDALFDLLRAKQLLITPKKSYTKTTYSKHWLRKHPNLYSDMPLTCPEQAFVSDITYLKTRGGTHYLSLVTDAYSRKIMGYHLSNNMMVENVVKALKMTLINRITNHPAIHHSDRGLQYASSLYQKTLKKAGIKPSMTDGYDCYQNALAERINGILKQEFFINTCNSFKELQKLVKESVAIYNAERPHLNLRMETPNAVHKKACELTLTGSR